MTRRFFTHLAALILSVGAGISGCGDAGSGDVGPISKGVQAPAPGGDPPVTREGPSPSDSALR